MNRPVLTEVTLLAGAPGGPPLRIPLTSCTIFVGPNNAGKSLVLRELESYFIPGDSPRQIVQSVTVAVPTREEAIAFMNQRAFVVNDTVHQTFS